MSIFLVVNGFASEASSYLIFIDFIQSCITYMDNFTLQLFFTILALCCQTLAISANQQMIDITKDPDHGAGWIHALNK